MAVAEVAVAGIGPAACAAAITAADLGAEVLLIAGGEGLRASQRLPTETLGARGQRALTNLSLHSVVSTAPTVTGRVSTWGSVIPTHRPQILSPFPSERIIDKPCFNAALLESAISQGVRISRKGRVVSGKETSSIVRLELGNGEAVECGFLIDATGVAAKLARQFGARRCLSDRLVCRWIELQCVIHDHDRQVFVDSLSDGWLFSTLGLNHKRVIAHFSDLKSNSLSLNAIPEMVMQTATRSVSIRHFLSGARVNTSGVTIAATSRLDSVAGRCWIACGDAAMTRDPLSSSGTSWALESGIAAARAAISGSTAQYVDFVAKEHAQFLEDRRRVYSIVARHQPSEFFMSRACIASRAIREGDGAMSVT